MERTRSETLRLFVVSDVGRRSSLLSSTRSTRWWQSSYPRLDAPSPGGCLWSAKRMLTSEEERRILENAPPYLRVAIVLLAQTGGRTYTEGSSLRWDQMNIDHSIIFFGGETKPEGAS